MPKNKSLPKQEIIEITSFDDLAPREVTLEFESGGRLYRLPCRELSYDQLLQVDRDIPEPTAQVFEGPAGRYYDTQDPGYLRARVEVGNQRIIRRILLMLPFTIPGDTPAEQVSNFRAKVGMGFIDALMKALNKIQFTQEARIDALADSFRSGGSGDEPDTEGARVDAATVAEPAV